MMRKTYLMIATLLLLASGCSKKNQDTAQNAYVAEAEVEKIFVKGCVDSALQTANGKFSDNAITQMCLCSLGQIREQYSVAQLEALDRASKTEQLAFTKLAFQSGMECGKQHLNAK